MVAATSVAKKNISRLLFVYDADSGKLAAVADSLKKLVGKGCPLCAVTHGLASKSKEICLFEQSVAVPIKYLHRDEAAHDPLLRGQELPCIVAEVEGDEQLAVLMGPRAIERLRGTEGDLKRRLEFRAASLGLELPSSASGD